MSAANQAKNGLFRILPQNKKTSAFARKGRKCDFRGTTFIDEVSHPTRIAR
ncbi:hypothetical protein ABEO75_00235 [Paenibacillus macerans]|uniref:hypothetical protein n=1 Tax=Paenibacillus macerans TaxID=44252 RepID=UPI002E21712F|nr:hypothetical protein [Paenibacillus macerans]